MGWQNARETLLHGGVSGFISNRNSFESPWLRWQHVWKKLHLTSFNSGKCFNYLFQTEDILQAKGWHGEICRNMLKHEENVPNSPIHFRSNIFQRPKAGMVMRVEKSICKDVKTVFAWGNVLCGFKWLETVSQIQSWHGKRETPVF